MPFSMICEVFLHLKQYQSIFRLSKLFYLFAIRFLMPDISAHVFLITLRVLFLLTAALQLQSHYLNMIPSSRHFLLLSSKWNSVFFCQIPLFFFQTLHKHSVWKNSEDDSELLPLIKNAIAARSRTLLEEYLSHSVRQI